MYEYVDNGNLEQLLHGDVGSRNGNGGEKNVSMDTRGFKTRHKYNDRGLTKLIF